MTFLRGLLEAIETIDPDGVVSPETEVKESDTVIGPMSDYLKRLHGYREGLSDEMEALIESSKAEINAITIGDQEAAMAKAKETSASLEKMEKDRDLISSIFWAEARLEFPQADNETLGIRLGFQVVTIEEECGCPICTITKMLDSSVLRGIAVRL